MNHKCITMFLFSVYPFFQLILITILSTRSVFKMIIFASSIIAFFNVMLVIKLFQKDRIFKYNFMKPLSVSNKEDRLID